MTERRPQTLPALTADSGVPKVRGGKIKTADAKRSGRWLMIACGVPMAVVAGLFVWQTAFNVAWSQGFYALAPLIACVGVHLLIHRFSEHRCSSNNQAKTKEDDNA